MAAKGKIQYLVWPPFAHLELFLGDCLEVFLSNLLVYYTSLPSVLQSSSLDLGCPLFISLSRWSHTASIIFRSGPCGGQSMTVNVLSVVFLSKYDFTGISSGWSVTWYLLHALETVLGDTANLLAMAHMCHPGGAGLPVQPEWAAGTASCYQ